MRKLDLVGARFGLLAVISDAGVINGARSWNCRCDCGALSTVRHGNLRNGHTISCGCMRAVVTGALKVKHGMFGTPTYRSWSGMLTRCTNSENKKFLDYGGRGIQVCERWRSFENFLLDMGIRPVDTSLGRINNDGNYEPTNCRWESDKQQARNKRNSRRVEFQGKSATIGQHCEDLGLNLSTVRSRIYAYGWTVERALSTKPHDTL